ncbi:hypothetical protein [Bradyrhizobium sp. USDA 4452]
MIAPDDDPMTFAGAEAKLEQMEREVTQLESRALRIEFQRLIDEYRDIIKQLYRCYH